MFTFIETPLFTKLVYDYLTEEEYAAFQQFLADRPEAGMLIKGSGGVRKIRWKRSGTGKSGGVRIIYFAKLREGVIWLITIYAKSGRESIPGHVLKAMKEELTDAKDR